MSLRKNLLSMVFLPSLLLVGCGEDFNLGGGGEEFNLGGGGGDFSGGGSGGTGGKGGTGGTGGAAGFLIATLDCNNLDPDKVYIFGLLGVDDGNISTGALAAPEDPSHYCVGFNGDADIDMPARISPAGTVLYGFNSTLDALYEMVQEDIVLERFDAGNGATLFSRAYPVNPRGNDRLLMEGTGDRAFIKAFDTGWLRSFEKGAVESSDGSVYFANPNQHDNLIGVLPDGGLLYEDCLQLCGLSNINRSLVYVSPSFEETVLDLPQDDFRIYTDRIKVSSGQIAWLAVTIDGEDHRWRINLGNNSVMDEGVFTEMPADLVKNSRVGGDVLDGDGALWGGAYSISLDSSVVYKRPIASSGQAVEVVYVQPDVGINYVWNADLVFPVVKGTILVTGQ